MSRSYNTPYYRSQHKLRHHRKDSCARKLRYDSLREAQFEIDRAWELRREILRAYTCDKCPSIHLTRWESANSPEKLTINYLEGERL